MDAKTAEKKYGIAKGVFLNHPMFGVGQVVKVLPEGVELRWTNPYHRIKSPKMISESEIVFMTKVITEEKKMKQNRKVVLEFDLPDPKDSMFTSMDPMSKGSAAPLATLDGNGSPGTSWKPSMSSDPKDAPSPVKVAGGSEGKVSVPKTAGSPKGGDKSQPKGNPFAKKDSAPADKGSSEKKENPFAKKDESSSSDDEDNKEKRVSEMQLTWEDISSLLAEKKNGEDEKSARADRLKNKDKDKKKFDKKDDLEESKDELEECDGDDKEVKEDMSGGDNMNVAEHDMAAGEIAVTPELLKAILQTAVKDQPDDSAIDKIVAGFSGCCGDDRTLDVSDIGEIMAAIKGDASGGDVGAEEDIAPADGEVAGAEGGAEHEGKDMLMQGQKQPLGKMSGKPGQKFKNAIKPSYVEGRKAPKGGKIDEAWLAAIPNAAVINGQSRLIVDENDDEDIRYLKEIAHRAGLEYKGPKAL